MKKNSLITVVTVVLNAEKHIEKTIQSIINQTYSNIEYIVIDGGSTDGTLEIIEKYKDKINYFVSEHDNGIFDAMNKGIDLATGEWINFMNAGDYFYKDDVLEKTFANKEIEEDFVYGGFINNYHIGKNNFSKEIPSPGINDELWKNYPCHQSSFVRTNIMKENKFDIDDPLEKEAGDYAKFLDFYYKQKLKFKKEDIIVANYLGGGFSSAIVFENLTFSGLKLKINRWKLIYRYINNYKIHMHYILLIIRTIFLMLILKVIPDYLKFKLFQRFYCSN